MAVNVLKQKIRVNSTQRVSSRFIVRSVLHHYKDQPPTQFREFFVSFYEAVHILVYMLSTNQQMVPAVKAALAHVREFAVNDELQSHKTLAQSTLLEVPSVFRSRTFCRSYQ